MTKFAERIFADHPVEIIGRTYHATDIPPCYRCSTGKVCKVGGLWAMIEFGEERLRKLQITLRKFKRWKECLETVAKISRYVKILAEL